MGNELHLLINNRVSLIYTIADNERSFSEVGRVSEVLKDKAL